MLNRKNKDMTIQIESIPIQTSKEARRFEAELQTNCQRYFKVRKKRKRLKTETPNKGLMWFLQ